MKKVGGDNQIRKILYHKDSKTQRFLYISFTSGLGVFVVKKS